MSELNGLSKARNSVCLVSTKLHLQSYCSAYRRSERRTIVKGLLRTSLLQLYIRFRYLGLAKLIPMGVITPPYRTFLSISFAT